MNFRYHLIRCWYLLLASGLAVQGQILAQSPTHHDLDKVQLRIERDPKYSRLFAVKFRKREFQEKFKRETIYVNREKLVFLHDDGQARAANGTDTPQTVTSYHYQLIYLPENGNQPILLALQEIIATGTRGGLYRSSRRDASPPVVVSVITPRDFFTMKQEHPLQYQELQAFVRERHREANQIGPDFRRTQPVSNHVTDDNRDYVRFASLHSSFPVEATFSTEPVSVDATFSRLSFSSRIFSERSWLGVSGFGIEFAFGDRVLNLLSYQAPYLSWGVRFLLIPAGSDRDILDSFFMDIHIRGRSPINTGGFIKNTHLDRATPVFTLHPAKLNVTSGVAFEAKIGRAFNDRLPFINFYYSGGSKEFAKPYSTFTEHGSPTAYFSTIQWEASFSYFWNFDNSAFNRMRLDIGAGSYNVWQAYYDSSKSTVLSSLLISPLTQVRPLIALTYTHASDDAKLGAGIRFFDNRLTLTPWIKVFESIPHQIRIEFTAVTRSVGRSPLPWEADKGSLLQLRYRYGFDENVK